MRIRIVELNCRPGVNFKFLLQNAKHGHLFVRFKSRAHVLTEEGYVDALPGDFIFYRGEEQMGYGSDNWAFVHDYFRFYLDSEEDDLFTVPTSRLFSAPLPSKLDDILHLIVREFYSANKNKDSSLDLLGRLFLLGADELVRQRDALPQKNHDDLLALRIRMLSSSELDWSVEKLAREVHLSPSYFQGVYKSLFGISPINDLIEARIKRAEEYLISSNKKETEIAALTGYRNVEHFIRQFKRIKGCTPSEFRKGI